MIPIKRNPDTGSAARQQGAALLTTLVFLIVLTIVGVSSMQNNRLEQKMSTNIQEINHAFQYAESGLPRGLRSGELFDTGDTGEIEPDDHLTPDMWLCADGSDPSLPHNCGTSSNPGNASILTRYRGRGSLPPANYSLEAGFATHFFQVQSQGYVSNKGVTDNSSIRSRSRHEYGLSLVGPSGL
jgi:Tfp pilus assembly protein PilX